MGEDTLLDTETPAPAPDPESQPERPEYVREQFWDGDKGEVRLESMAKSLNDTQSRLNQVLNREPGTTPESFEGYVSFGEDGNLVVPDGLDNLPPIAQDDPLLRSVLTAAFEQNLEVEQLTPILNAFWAGQNELFAEVSFDEDAVYAGIHDSREKAEGIVNTLNVFLGGMELDEDMQSAAAEIMASSGGIKLLHAVAAGHRDLPVAAKAAPAPSFDREAANARWNQLRGMDLKFGTPEFEEFENLGNKLFPQQG